MQLSNQELDWTFDEDGVSGETSGITPMVQSTDNLQAPVHPARRPYWLYELFVSVVLIYGIGVFLLWQQTERRIGLLETELDIIQDTAQTQGANATAMRTGPNHAEASTVTSAIAMLPHRIETEHLTFVTSEATADLVRSLALRSDVKYQQLRRDFGLSLSRPAGKVTIVVDPADKTLGSGEQLLVVPAPATAAVYYNIAELEVLQNDIFKELTKQAVNQAMSGRTFRRQWRAMSSGLQFYLQREHGHRRHWQQEATYHLRRVHAQQHSIDHVLLRVDAEQLIDSYAEWLSRDAIADEVADPLVEFILETYGYPRVPVLLDAFETYDSWEAVAPAVFGISAQELEANWHAYLAQHYPWENSVPRKQTARSTEQPVNGRKENP